MKTCTICRFETELDDVALAGGPGRCVCLRCFARETATELTMPKALRREIIAALVSVEVA
jgi:hypothetical protein